MLEVTDGALLMLALLLFFDSEGLLPSFLAAAAFHELGHVLALWATGGKLRRLRLSAVGGRMDCVLPSGRLRCFAVHLAGPAANLAAFLLLRAAGAYLFAGANFVLFGFNLLPVSPLDGYSCLETLAGGTARRGQKAAGFCLALVLCTFGAYLFCTGNGLSLAAIGAFLAVFSYKNLQNC